MVLSSRAWMMAVVAACAFVLLLTAGAMSPSSHTFVLAPGGGGGGGGRRNSADDLPEIDIRERAVERSRSSRGAASDGTEEEDDEEVGAEAENAAASPILLEEALQGEKQGGTEENKESGRTILRAAVFVLLAKSTSTKHATVDTRTIDGLGVLRESILNALGRRKRRRWPAEEQAPKPLSSGFTFVADSGSSEDSPNDVSSKLPYGASCPHPATRAPHFVGSGGGSASCAANSSAAAAGYGARVAPRRSTVFFPSTTPAGKARGLHVVLEFVLLVSEDLQIPDAIVTYIFNVLRWQVRIARSPLQPHEIRNSRIAQEVVTDGALGINEMIKLEALRFHRFDKVLVLDADMMFHRRFDELFDLKQVLGWTHGGWPIERINGGFLVVSPRVESGLLSRVCPTKGQDAESTHGDTDGAAAASGEHDAPPTTSGASAICPRAFGYPVVTEGDVHFANIVELLREGDFRPGTGWKGSDIGWTYGGRTIQGLLPYYFFIGIKLFEARVAALSRVSYDGAEEIESEQRALFIRLCEEVRLRVDIEDAASHTTAPPHEVHHVELDTCRYNHMAQLRKCLQLPLAQVTSNHFTGRCPKPWFCTGTAQPMCAHFHAQWFETYARFARRVWRSSSSEISSSSSSSSTPERGDGAESARHALLDSIVAAGATTGLQAGGGHGRYGRCTGQRLDSLVKDWVSAFGNRGGVGGRKG